MREIKFRGLSINGEWYYGLLSHSTGEKGHTVPEGWYISNKAGMPGAYQVRPETVGQYTGLKDKEGVEIYEGDILVAEQYPYFDEGERNYVAVVEWCFAGFHSVKYCVNPNKVGISEGINEPLEEGEEFSVIGNAYEHPHLIK